MNLELEIAITRGFSSVLSDLISTILGELTRLLLL